MFTRPSLIRFFFTLIWCLSILNANAQAFLSFRSIPANYELEPVVFSQKKEVDFLVDAVEDNEGFLWFSGNKSIYVYDGNKVVQYINNGREYSLKTGASSDESYGIITKDTSGKLYIQERDYYSFICFDPSLRKLKYEFKPRSAGYQGLKFIMSISNRNDMMGVFLDQKHKRYTIKPAGRVKDTKEVFSGYFNPDQQVMFSFGAGNHWLFHRQQIVQVTPDGARTKIYHLPDKQDIGMIYADKDNVFFLNKDCTRIYTWEPNSDKIILYLSLPGYPVMRSLYSPSLVPGDTKFVVKDEMIYLGNERGFYVINTKEGTVEDLTEVYNKDTGNSKVENELFKILLTRKGSIFLLKGNRVLQLRRKRDRDNPFLVSLKSENGNKNLYSFRAITEDDEGGIYASYYNGLIYRKKGDRFFEDAPFAKKLYPKIASLYSLNYWKGHLLWNNLLYSIKSGQYRFLDEGNKMVHTTQYLQHDTLWYYIWESGKIHCYDLSRHKQKVYDIDKKVGAFGEAIEEINDMIPDHSGMNLWLATKWDGVVLITKDGQLLKKFSWKELKIKEGLGATVYKLHLSGNELWYGCADGLGLLNTKTGANEIFHNPYNKDGLLNNREIYSLLLDNLGNFYLGTSKGIAYFNREERKFYNLPENHALAFQEFNRASAFKASDNRYYFGSTTGLYSFMAEDLPFNRNTVHLLPPIKMFNINVFNSRSKQYKYFGVWPESGKDLVLMPNENTISINFSVPDFDKTVYYSYRILEQDENWKEYSLDNRIYLYSLRAGTYTLAIKASTDLSDDTARFFTINIIIQQVWHKLVWVRLLFLGGVITIVVFIMRWRYREKLRKQQELANLRLKISMDLHDDVGSILSGLAVQSEMLSYTSTEPFKQPLNDISTMSRKAMETMRDIVWAMDNRKDKYENLIDRMKAFAEKTLHARNISHIFILERIVGEQFIAPEKRQAIYLIFKEALTNIIRHSDATHVVIKMIRQKQSLFISIHDNGIELSQTTAAGMGTDNMKLRAERIGAVFSASWDKGYLVRLTVPLIK